MCKEYFEEQRQKEAAIRVRYPGIDVFYNWFVALCLVALVISFICWGLDIRTRHIADQMTATAMASWQADLDAERSAKEAELAAVQASQEYVMKKEATAVAKAFYGIRLFIEKYHYTERDLATYARCMFNRAEGKDLCAVISAKDQFVGYSDNNAVLTDDYNLALKLVEEWHNEDTKPCDISYQYAELTPTGIYLKNDFHADGYARRWQA